MTPTFLPNLSAHLFQASYGEVSHRETWQDDLQRKDELISTFLTQLEAADRREEYLEAYIRLLDLTIASLHDQLAEKEAEIIRLSLLLDAQAKKKRP